MTPFQQTANHSVFLVSRRGDALIVRPRGDSAGFGQSDIRMELSRIERLLALPEFPNLIFDLGAARYFGPVVIGQTLRLGRKVIDRGGEFALCNVSDDMSRGLKIHEPEPFWAEYDTERAALSKVAHESVVQKAVRHRRKLLVATIMASAYMALAFYPFSHRAESHLADVESVWKEYRMITARGASAEEFQAFADKTLNRLEPEIAELERISSRRRAAERFVFFAARDCLLPLIKAGVTIEPEYQAGYNDLFVTYTKHARIQIDGDKKRLNNPLTRVALGNLAIRI